MELLRYSKRNTIVLKKSFDQITEKWFGCKSYLNTERNKGYLDSSMDKERVKKWVQSKKIIRLKAKLSETSEKALKFRNMQQKLGQHLKNLKDFKEKFVDSEKLMKIMNMSAIKIQKVVRGYLVRKVYEKKLIEWSRDNVRVQLNDIEKNDKFCLWFVGKQCQDSAKVIQRFFRSCLFRKKLKKMHEFYLVVLKAKELERSRKMRPIFALFNAKIRMEKEKELRDFSRKLMKIRKKLAIFKIKSILKKKKIKVKSIRHRIRRFLKKSNSLLSAPNTQSLIASSPSIIDKSYIEKATIDKHSPEKSVHIDLKPSSSQLFLNDLPKLENNERSIDRYSLTSEYFVAQEALKKEKLLKTRMAYSISFKPPTLILPLFQDYDPDSRPQTTRSTMNRTNLTNPIRLVPDLTPKHKQGRKPISIIMKNKKEIRKYGVDDEPPYTKDTISSIMRYEESPEPEIKHKPSALSLNTGLLCNTFSFCQKIKAPSFETQKKEINKFRPSTGPQVGRRFVRSNQKSCANISDFYFDPPLVEVSEMETQNFRPFYARVRPALEKLKINHSRFFSQN